MKLRFAALALFLLALSACTVPVASGVDETEANRIVIALDHASIGASKEADAVVEGRFRVLVARDDVASALGAMRAEELPRPRSAGVLESVGKGSLVPSQAAEQAQLAAGVAGDLQKTLESIDGILTARVHLNLPPVDPLRDVKDRRATASVMVEHRGATPPVTSDAVARLVAGGAPNLAATDVAVILVSRAAPAANTLEPSIAHLGPIAIAKSSLKVATFLLVGLIVLVGVMTVTAALLWLRLSRTRQALQAAEAAAPQASEAARRTRS